MSGLVFCGREYFGGWIAVRLEAMVLGSLRKTIEKKGRPITHQRDFGQRDAKGELRLSKVPRSDLRVRVPVNCSDACDRWRFIVVK
jgi:hypothetical protein